MLHCIQVLTNTSEVTMHVKSDKHVGKTILNKLLIYYEYMCLSRVSTLFGKICCLFSNCNYIYSYITYYLRCKWTTFFVSVLLTMQWSVALWPAFWRGREETFMNIFQLKSLRFRQKNQKNWGLHRDFSSILPIYTLKSLILLNVVWIHSTIYMYVTFFADKCLKMKLLIDICTVKCRIKKKCTG